MTYQTGAGMALVRCSLANILPCRPSLALSPSSLSPSVFLFSVVQGDALRVMFTSPNHAARTNADSNSNSLPNSHQPCSKPSSQPKDTVHVVGVPAVSIQNGKLVVGDANSSSSRSFTPIKTLGDGSFGTVLLCDWHGTLPPDTPLSPMQCGGGARPEWVGKRLVAVKKMRKKWEGGWDECKKLKELESLRAIPFHPCIIPLYDFFLLPDTKELYFVFESMEGNLYHLIKARKGRPLAGGLVASIFRQVVSGLHHIHASGYFHRDMKPENVLVTTTGLFEYRSLSPVSPPGTTEKDVVAIIKLADFGLARETLSSPPYTTYVSTRWYRAPEVLISSRDYSNPVDMWALGTIMAELVNLRPLFPGSDCPDQIHRICEILGDPVDYGTDSRGKPLGGGRWNKGLKIAKQLNFAFPKSQPKDFYSYFDRSVPRKLIECISDLLKYDPDLRLTSRQCLEHPYLIEALPQNVPPMPPALYVQTLSTTPAKPHINGAPFFMPSASPRSIPPSHSHNSLPKSSYPPNPHPIHIPDASSSHRTAFVPSIATSGTHTPGSPKVDPHELPPPSYMQEEARIQGAPPPWPTDHSRNGSHWVGTPPPQAYPSLEEQGMAFQSSTAAECVLSRSLCMFRKPSRRRAWGLGMFGHGDKVHRPALPPVDEDPGSSSVPSLKRTQSIGSDTPLAGDGTAPNARKDAKAIRKEAERLQREAEKQRRAMAERAHREQARAVMQKRNQMLMQTTCEE
ncbi:kinase-like domain-containing protein [Pisolithus thermaeus]|nr:kinase-like domain-containing protein [Pisolithus thermaeus]